MRHTWNTIYDKLNIFLKFNNSTNVIISDPMLVVKAFKIILLKTKIKII